MAHERRHPGSRLPAPHMASIQDAIALLGQGRLPEAEATCRAILAREPASADALNILGSIKLRQQAPAEALKCFEQIVSIRPRSPEVLCTLAFVLLVLHRPTEALSFADRALALDPKHAAAWTTRGNALSQLERLHDALSSYDAALKLAANDIEALIGRGSVLASLGRPDDAIAAFGRIPVGHNPSHLFNRANLQLRLGLLAAAARDFRRLAELPSHPLPAWVGLARCASETCDWSALEKPRRMILSAVDAGQPVEPLLTLWLSSDPAQHLKSAQARAPRVAQTAWRPARGLERPERLRIAYISPDFRIHPLAYLIPELLERHDRRRFELVGVSLGPPDGSDIRARIVAAFDQFHDLQGRPDEAIVALLRSLNIDIAIDLAGYTEYARPGVFARRCAPIQVGYLGYCGTSGSDFIDYLLVDPIAVPPAQQPYFTEKLVYLPDSFMVADTTQAISEATPTRRDCGLPEHGLVFCCFNKNYKFTQPVFDVWLRLLRSVEGGALWLSGNRNAAHDNLRRYAKAQGIDPQRLVFAAGVKARADHFARHRLADMFLDTVPYNAHTTACDALFCGLPVLTMAGPTFAGRVAASMLHAIGLDELVTDSLADYEALALSLATEPARLGAIRARLADNRMTHPLFDTDRFRRNIETAYDRMFDDHSRGEPPRSFSVAGHLAGGGQVSG